MINIICLLPVVFYKVECLAREEIAMLSFWFTDEESMERETLAAWFWNPPVCLLGCMNTQCYLFDAVEPAYLSYL